MSRQIKFRAYHSKYGLGHVISMSFYEKTKEYNSDTECYAYYPKMNDALLTSYSEVQIMQFTGLIDMNGKDIYEGDIVTGFVGHSSGYLRKNFPRKVKVICEVIFDRGMFQAVLIKPIQEHQYAYENGDYRTNYYSLKAMFKNTTYYRPSDGKQVIGDGKTCEYIEVIGNVYENKELLEESE